MNNESKMIVLTVLLVVAQCDRGSSELRIYNGRTAAKNAYPFLVSIYNLRYNGHKCGGVIVDELNVLTAAHCARDSSPRDFKVLTGDYIKNFRDVEQERHCQI